MAAVYLGLPSHEAYQIKGQFIGSRNLTAEELETSYKIRNHFIDMITEMGTLSPKKSSNTWNSPEIINP